jgi:hypothetical protein
LFGVVFRDERQRILVEIEKQTPPDDYTSNLTAALKRLDGKRTGAAKFQAIARTVASRWSALSDRDKEPFQKLAKQEMANYKIKKGEYQRRALAKNQAESDLNKNESAVLLHPQTRFGQSGAGNHNMAVQDGSSGSFVSGPGAAPPMFMIPPANHLATSFDLPNLMSQYLTNNLTNQSVLSRDPGMGTGSLPSAALQGHILQPNGDFLLPLTAHDLCVSEAAFANRDQQILDSRLRGAMAAQQLSSSSQEQQLRARLALEGHRQALVQEQVLRSHVLGQQQSEVVSESSQQTQNPVPGIISQEILAGLSPEQRNVLLEQLSRMTGS